MGVGVCTYTALLVFTQLSSVTEGRWRTGHKLTLKPSLNNLLLHECLLCSYKGSSFPTRVPLTSLFSFFSFIILALCQLFTYCGVVWCTAVFCRSLLKWHTIKWMSGVWLQTNRKKKFENICSHVSLHGGRVGDRSNSAMCPGTDSSYQCVNTWWESLVLRAVVYDSYELGWLSFVATCTQLLISLLEALHRRLGGRRKGTRPCTWCKIADSSCLPIRTN